MAVLLNKDGLVPSLEEMAGSTMTFVKKLSVNSVQLPHAEGKISIRRFDQEMVMIIHKAVGVTDPMVAFDDVLDGIEEFGPILIVSEDRLLLVAPGGDMIHRAGIFDS
jgi:hypothetical protein